MSLTKAETNQDILLDVKSRVDNELSKVNIRNLDSVHPHQCFCDLCLLMMKDYTFNSNKEKEAKERLGYYTG